ncbi:MAG: proline--tRNA ligase [Deltaproteobacteria bacterium]
MRQSKLFVPTLKETPAEASVASHVLLLRGGYLRPLAAGIYSYLPLFQRVLRKVEAIIREEMAAIGAQEFYLPALHPAEIWKETGRWDVMGDNMFRLKDRGGRDMCLGMTHEEIFTAIARDELRSYRQLPQVWYQIQTKFRDEQRPKSGVLRVRQFTMKDAYSFDVDQAGLDRSFEDERRAYCRIFERAGLSFVAVDAHSGAMGGSASTEFMVKTTAGEDDVVHCAACGYAANVERAESRGATGAAMPGPAGSPKRFPTPGVKTIDDLAAPPFGKPAAQQLKTLVYDADGALVVAVVRGDDELNEAKLQTATGAQLLRPAHVEEISKALRARPGSLGAVGLEVGEAAAVRRLFVDRSLRGLTGMVTGANEDGFHLEGVDVDRDLGRGTLADLRKVRQGERCARCEQGTLDVFKALEVGHIFKLGTKYSASLGARVLDAQGQEVPIVMGSYGIGVERIAAAAVELHHDENGILWPASIAPFQVALLPLQQQDPDVVQAAERIYSELGAAGIEVLLDDRDERPGVKFKDADLIGLPFRLAVGKKSLAEGKVELKPRAAKQAELVPLAEIVARLRAELAPNARPAAATLA